MKADKQPMHSETDLEATNRNLIAENIALRKELNNLLTSTSWRITKPLRGISETARNLKNTKHLKRKLRETAYSQAYRIKICWPYRKLRQIPALHGLYMSLKSKVKKPRRYIVDLTDDQLRSRVENYLIARGERSKAKVVVYTAVIDNYDTLKIPLELNPEWDYVCFTDRVEFPGTHPWEIRAIPYIDADPTRCARFVKLRPDICLPEYEQSIWIDASILSKDSFLMETFEAFVASQFLVASIPHPLRTCTYAEFEACKELKKDSPELLDEQKNECTANGFPSQQGLIETGLLLRKHKENKVVNFQKAWWKLLNQYSRRDQLSVIPALKSVSLEWMEIMPKGLSTANHPSFYIFSHGTKWSSEAIQYKVPGFLPREFYTATTPFWTTPVQQPFSTDSERNLPQRPVDIVVCVHNAPEDVDRCLQSVIDNLQPLDRVIIVDDGSESRTARIIDQKASSSHQFMVIRHDEPIGYTRSANVGLKASQCELVILLNSDTIVTPNWTRKLLQVASQGDHIGIVGPVSNAASFQSIPRVKDPKTGKLAINELSKGTTIADMNQLCEHHGNANSFPLVPLVNGFCMGITRRVIDTIGYLDEDGFPVGYGEEDDYSQRALDAGFMHAIATHCYVYHAKSKSFGHSRRSELAKTGGEYLRQKHGTARINRAVKTMAQHPVLATLRHRIATDLGIQLDEEYKTKLSRHPSSWTTCAQSLALSSKAKRKSAQPAPSQGSSFVENQMLVLRSRPEALESNIGDIYGELISRIDKKLQPKAGTINDIIERTPKKVLIDNHSCYAKDDLREIISFCKSRNITIYYAPELGDNSAAGSKSSAYLQQLADYVLGP